MTVSTITTMPPGDVSAGQSRTSGTRAAGCIGVVRAVEELRALLAPERRAGSTIGLVPTMGALHDGHLSLIERARERCDLVVVSLFVNPSQFDERADLERYPRDERRDRELAERAGAYVLFAPGVDEVYPAGFATAVEVYGLTDRLEGAMRGAAHFRGVTTVVTKLLNMVAPNVAYFGQKDAQQVAAIRRLVADLNLLVRIETCPTVREHDGLAMSSRNARLSADERERAVALFGGLSAARAAVEGGERSAETLVARARAAMAQLGVEGGEVEYLELVDAATLEPVATLDRPALLAVAARVGKTRLIDNFVLEPHSFVQEPHNFVLEPHSFDVPSHRQRAAAAIDATAAATADHSH